MADNEAAKARNEVAEPSPLTRTDWQYLLALLILALAFRIPGLGAESLWFDELCTWRFSTYPTIGEVIQKGALEDFHPPGYVLFMHFWIKLFGDGEAALRMPSALAGALSVPAIYLLGRKLFGVRTGLIAATLLAVTVNPVYRSQEARSYTIVLLLSIVTVSLWVDVCRAAFYRARLPTWRVAALIASAAALAYMHYYGTLLVALQVAFFLLLAIWKRRSLGWALLAVGLFALVLLPWSGGISHHLALRESWIVRMQPIPATVSFITFLYGEAPITAFLLAALALAAFVPGSGFIENNNRWHLRAALLTLAWMLVPFILVEAKSLLGTPIYWPRYMMISMPAAMLLAGHAMARVRAPVAAPLAVAGVIAAVMWGYYEQKVQFLSKPQHEGWRQVIKTMVEKTPPRGRTVVLAITEKPGVADYYFRKFGSKLPIRYMTSRAELDQAFRWILADKPDFIWFLEGHPGVASNIVPVAVENLQATGTLLAGMRIRDVAAGLVRVGRPQPRRSTGQGEPRQELGPAVPR